MTIHQDFRRAYDAYYDNPRAAKLASARLNDSRTVGVGVSITKHMGFQQLLRPHFGKGTPNPPIIGDHPDFEALRGTSRTEYSPVTTLFVDMEGSTRIGLLHGPMMTYRIKNATICSAIDVVRAFDGHVHRIMGDAVMAYFGRKGEPPEQGAIDAINCAAVLVSLMDALVADKFREMHDDRFGVRIGVDYGARDDVLWASYGYPDMEEVTATSFYVDVAAKLQQCAGRNQVMLGESICSLLDFPEKLLENKSRIQDGRQVEEPYVLPNYSKADGTQVNYRKRALRWKDYLRCTNIGALAPELTDDSGRPDLVHVASSISNAKDGAPVDPWSPCSAMLDKQKWLRFEVEIRTQPRVPFEIKLRVENHGAEASAAEGHGNHCTTVEKKRNGDLSCVHWEHTEYRGLHYLDISVAAVGHSYSGRLGVYVK